MTSVNCTASEETLKYGAYDYNWTSSGEESPEFDPRQGKQVVALINRIIQGLLEHFAIRDPMACDYVIRLTERSLHQLTHSEPPLATEEAYSRVLQAMQQELGGV
jgi:hypothetical protein